jgi:hypothetical protein
LLLTSSTARRSGYVQSFIFNSAKVTAMRDKEAVRQELVKAGVGCMIFEIFWLRKISLCAENLRATEHILGGVLVLFPQALGDD